MIWGFYLVLFDTLRLFGGLFYVCFVVCLVVICLDLYLLIALGSFVLCGCCFVCCVVCLLWVDFRFGLIVLCYYDYFYWLLNIRCLTGVDFFVLICCGSICLVFVVAICCLLL